MFSSANCSPAHRQGNTKKNDFYKYYTSLTEPLHIEHNKNTFYHLRLLISQKSKQTDRFALKGLFLSTKHNATANFLQKIIKWKRHFWANALSFTKYQNLQGACSMWRRLKIWNFLGKILFFNIFLLRKWVSKIFKATFFGKNLLIWLSI